MSDEPRILIVDDEPYILRSLSYVLRKEGFTVDEARTCQEARDAAKAQSPDLVFLDLMLPDGNGLDLCRTLKETGRPGFPKIVILTARGQDQDRTRGLAEGASEYMTKPFSPSHIVRLARHHLGAA